MKHKRVRFSISSYSHCQMCLEMADMCNANPDCRYCEKTGEWFETVQGLFHSYALVKEDGTGKVRKVSFEDLTILED